ncbi:UBC-like protein [Serendipita vermifera]|nr:UBC-like protein [Serendipita vermifera]
MDAEHTQELEMEALKAIYGDDFQDVPPPKVWKGAATFPEFIIRVKPNDTELHGRVELMLHVKFPKTYPKVMATLTIDSSTGLSKGQVNQLLGLLKTEGQKALGREMVFELVGFCQDWITKNNSSDRKDEEDPNVSLAVQMEARATTQQQEHERLSVEAQIRQQQADQEQAAALARQIDEKKEEKRRMLALYSPYDPPDSAITVEESFVDNVYEFDKEIKWKGYVFHSVMLSNPVSGNL